MSKEKVGGENSQVFTPEDISNGLLGPFLNSLLAMQLKSKYPLDIHIWTDGECCIINWTSVFNGTPKYQLVDENEFIDGWIDGRDNNGRGVSYRRTDLEDPDFCADHGIVYDAEAQTWNSDLKKDSEPIDKKE